ncbi:hypothetical protein GTHT12_02383 [Geobacillus thermodenitrificans]|jgi:hypothetical protein|nr:hypothetical protein GTHT12_02383 [Geobacillus thermodenitrificans]MEC5186969.1 hypothetical protein [Geobacillus thermodenitrificans]
MSIEAIGCGFYQTLERLLAPETTPLPRSCRGKRCSVFPHLGVTSTSSLPAVVYNVWLHSNE